MIKQLKLSNFTAFKEAELNFSHGINVIIGENGTGKTHLLKLIYFLINVENSIGNFKKEWDICRNYLLDIFNVKTVDELKNIHSDGISKIDTYLEQNLNSSKKYSTLYETNRSHLFSTHFGYSALNLRLNKSWTDETKFGKTIYIPDKEIISWFKEFYLACNTQEKSFGKIYTDLAFNLKLPKCKEVSPSLEITLKILQDIVGGSLELEEDKFFLVSKDLKRTQANLLSKGILKLATLLHLIENGSLEIGDTLIWDNPETNLNPKLIKILVGCFYFLNQSGIQIIISTHNYFLLKELDILHCSSVKKFEINCINLIRIGNDVNIEQSASFDDISSWVTLDEELAQYDRCQALYYDQ